MDEADKIRREMALLRYDLHHDVSGVVTRAESFLNWRAYLRKMPWLGLGLAALAGYLVVPRAKTAHGESEPITRVVPREARPEPRKPRGLSAGALVSSALGFAWPIAMNLAQSYLLSLFDKALNPTQDASSSPDTPDPRAKRGEWTHGRT